MRSVRLKKYTNAWQFFNGIQMTIGKEEEREKQKSHHDLSSHCDFCLRRVGWLRSHHFCHCARSRVSFLFSNGINVLCVAFIACYIYIWIVLHTVTATLFKLHFFLDCLFMSFFASFSTMTTMTLSSPPLHPI